MEPEDLHEEENYYFSEEEEEEVTRSSGVRWVLNHGFYQRSLVLKRTKKTASLNDKERYKCRKFVLKKQLHFLYLHKRIII